MLPQSLEVPVDFRLTSMAASAVPSYPLPASILGHSGEPRAADSSRPVPMPAPDKLVIDDVGFF